MGIFLSLAVGVLVIWRVVKKGRDYKRQEEYARWLIEREESDRKYREIAEKARTEKARGRKQIQRNDRARELERAGRIDEAVKLYWKSVEEGFEGNYVYDRLAIIYRKAKDLQNEIAVLERAVYVFENVPNPSRADVAPKLEKFKIALQKARAKLNRQST